MPNVRDLIRMTPDEVDQFLQGRHTMSVATMRPDGRIHVVAMWYGFVDGKPAFETYPKSQKILNLRRDPRMTCLIDDGDRYENLRGVELEGVGTILEDKDAVREVAETMVARYHQELAGQAIGAFIENMVQKRVAVRVDAERVASWDHTKLGLGPQG